MLLMQRNRRSDFTPEEWRNHKAYPENREHYGVRYEMPRNRYIDPYGYDEPQSYYDERFHGGREPEMRGYTRYSTADLPRTAARNIPSMTRCRHTMTRVCARLGFVMNLCVWGILRM